MVRATGVGAMPPDRVGVKTGLLATGGRGPVEADVVEATGVWDSAEYLAPEESATLCTMPAGERSPSARAVIWTWYP
jgi:hypothetical protein